ncbi:MAG: sigma-70 family RNA polymerase sigma factor, partial [Vicinamibacterales bacterium]
MSTPTQTMAVADMDTGIAREAGTPALLTEREFHALYARTSGPLRAYVVRTMGHASHADDIVQETYVRILRKPVPTHTDDELRAYVFRIAGNLVIDHWRAHKHESPEAPPERSAAGPDQALRLDVGRLFARLKPRERQMMWLAHVEGADHREIAAVLGLRAASIRVLLSRARQRLDR